MVGSMVEIGAYIVGSLRQKLGMKSATSPSILFPLRTTRHRVQPTTNQVLGYDLLIKDK